MSCEICQEGHVYEGSISLEKQSNASHQTADNEIGLSALLILLANLFCELTAERKSISIRA